MYARDALEEARRLVGGSPEVRVLEPSPPAVLEGPWYADDPTEGGAFDWPAWVRRQPEDATWARERWLADYRRLDRPPPGYTETRGAMHRLAVYVISPARQRANGKMGLRWTLGGIGTPFFGTDEQVRTQGTDLVRQQGHRARAVPITSLEQAAEFVLGGPPDGAWAEHLEVPAAGPTGEKLPVDADGPDFLAAWYGFAWSVLEELRADSESLEPSRVQLWPEHFDAAFDCRPGTGGATFGVSPGDDSSKEPYLYVTSDRVPASPDQVWNATTFRGAVLPLDELTEVPDQRAAALDFFRLRRSVLEDS